MAGLRVASLISRGRDVASVSQSLHAQAAQFLPRGAPVDVRLDRAQPVADAMSEKCVRKTAVQCPKLA